jgi:hypothetical protein
MENVSSVIDGSIAVAGVIVALAVSGWALIASQSAGAGKNEAAVGDLPTTRKKAA